MKDEAFVNERPNAWGRWGPQDEAGALNLIGPAQVLRAAGLVREGRVVRLAQPLSHATPVPRHRAGLQHFMGRDGGDYAAGSRRPGGWQFAEDTVVMPLHIGTHIDALCHVWCDGRMFNNYRETTMRSTSGATRLGVEKMPPAFTRGILLDVVALRGRPLHAGEVVSRERLLAGAWGNNGDLSINTVDVYLGYLRRKLKAHGSETEITTVRGIGCRIGLAPDAGIGD